MDIKTIVSAENRNEIRGEGVGTTCNQTRDKEGQGKGANTVEKKENGGGGKKRERMVRQGRAKW